MSNLWAIHPGNSFCDRFLVSFVLLPISFRKWWYGFAVRMMKWKVLNDVFRASLVLSFVRTPPSLADKIIRLINLAFFDRSFSNHSWLIIHNQVNQTVRRITKNMKMFRRCDIVLRAATRASQQMRSTALRTFSSAPSATAVYGEAGKPGSVPFSFFLKPACN